MKTIDKFDSKKQHLFTSALVYGNWFQVDHFSHIEGSWMVWLCADHGCMSGFVDCSDVAEWMIVEE